MYDCGFDQIAAANLIYNSLSCVALIRLFMTGHHFSISVRSGCHAFASLTQPRLPVAEAALGGVGDSSEGLLW
jgi:hypothetical protein